MSPSRAGPRWERAGLLVLLAGFLAVESQLIRQGATYGQDFGFHAASTEGLMQHPHVWFYMDTTSRPLLYWIGGLCLRAAGPAQGYRLASHVFALLGAGALAVLHAGSRRLVSSPVLRLCLVAFVACLPCTLVTTVVYAADTLATLPFVLAAVTLALALEERSLPACAGWAAAAGAALALGNFAKATFLVLPFAALAVALVRLRTARLDCRRLLAVGVLSVLAPLAIGGWLMAKAKRQLAAEPSRHSFNWRGTGEMTFRSLLAPRAGDARILDAPLYFHPETGPGGNRYLPLLVPNSFSYPALLHLGTFTDVLNYSRNAAGGTAARPAPQAPAARWSVREGLIFSLVALAAAAGFWISVGRRLFRPRGISAAALSWSFLGTAWFAAMAAPLPFVYHAYDWGYWLPRLVLPALWAAFLGGFAGIDRLIAGRARWGAAAAALLTATQCASGLASVWYPLPPSARPSDEMDRIEADIRTVEAAIADNLAALRQNQLELGALAREITAISSALKSQGLPVSRAPDIAAAIQEGLRPAGLAPEGAQQPAGRALSQPETALAQANARLLAAEQSLRRSQHMVLALQGEDRRLMAALAQARAGAPRR